MYLSVRDLETRKAHFDLVLQPGELDFRDKRLRQATPLAAAGFAELLGATQEIRIKGRLSVQMVTECDRCLEDAVFPLEQDFDLLYRPVPIEGETGEKELDDSAAELAFYEGGGLETGWARGVSQQGELVALLEFDDASNEWQPKKVFFS